MLKPDIETLLAPPATPPPTIRDILDSAEVVARPTFGFEPSPIAAIRSSMLAPRVTKEATKDKTK